MTMQGEFEMPRLIDAEELELQFDVSDEDIIAKEIIRNAPTVDAVPVVRCQKCIFYDPANCSNWCCHPKGLCNPGESDFCSYGRIREVGE